jgi:hypothetical protein
MAYVDPQGTIASKPDRCFGHFGLTTKTGVTNARRWAEFPLTLQIMTTAARLIQAPIALIASPQAMAPSHHGHHNYKH